MVLHDGFVLVSWYPYYRGADFTGTLPDLTEQSNTQSHTTLNKLLLIL